MSLTHLLLLSFYAIYAMWWYQNKIIFSIHQKKNTFKKIPVWNVKRRRIGRMLKSWNVFRKYFILPEVRDIYVVCWKKERSWKRKFLMKLNNVIFYLKKSVFLLFFPSSSLCNSLMRWKVMENAFCIFLFESWIFLASIFSLIMMMMTLKRLGKKFNGHEFSHFLCFISVLNFKKMEN